MSIIKAAFKRVYGFFIVRPLQRFNVINRGHKVLEKQDEQQKPLKVAPWHPGTREKIGDVIGPHREIIRKEILEKKPELDERLKEVKVVSQTVEDKPLSEEDAQMRELVKDRYRRYKIPTERKAKIAQGWWHAYVEPDEVPEGKVTLTNAMRMLALRYAEPEKWTVEELARKGRLEIRDVENTLEYFKPFKAWIPTEENAKWYEEGYYIVAPKEHFNLFALTTGDLDEQREMIEEEKERQFIEEMARKREEAIAAGKPMNELPPIPLTKKQQAALEAEKKKEEERQRLIEMAKKTWWEDEELEDKLAGKEKKNIWGAWGPVPPWADGWDRILEERTEMWRKMDQEKKAVQKQWSIEAQRAIGHEPPPEPRSFPDDHPFAHLYNPPKKEPLTEIESGQTSQAQEARLEDGLSSSSSAQNPLKISQSSDAPPSGEPHQNDDVRESGSNSASTSPYEPLSSSKEREDVKERISAKAVGGKSSRNKS